MYYLHLASLLLAVRDPLRKPEMRERFSYIISMKYWLFQTNGRKIQVKKYSNIMILIWSPIYYTFLLKSIGFTIWYNHCTIVPPQYFFAKGIEKLFWCATEQWVRQWRGKMKGCVESLCVCMCVILTFSPQSAVSTVNIVNKLTLYRRQAERKKKKI